jgi:hypothetical protein
MIELPKQKQSVSICSKTLTCSRQSNERAASDLQYLWMHKYCTASVSIYGCSEEITGTLVTNSLMQIPWIDFVSSKLITQLRL